MQIFQSFTFVEVKDSKRLYTLEIPHGAELDEVIEVIKSFYDQVVKEKELASANKEEASEVKEEGKQ